MVNRSSSIDLIQEQRTALADMLDRCRKEIVQKWLEKVRTEVVDNKEIHPTELQNAIPDYLSLLAKALRQDNGSDTDSKRGGNAWMAIAKEHSITRLRQGFNIEQLVHEFILLRRVLMEFVKTEGLLANIDQFERLTDLVEAAISIAVSSYVYSRDFEFRKMEAEHIGFITHELKNPLTTATLVASEICQKLSHSEEMEKLCKILESTHMRIADLIGKVLLTEKLQVHGIQVNPSDTTLGDILKEPLRDATEIARRKGIQLHAVFDPQLLLRIDPNLTRSAIENILDNAVKYTDVGSVEISAEHSSDRIIIHVRDQCPGISDEELRIIFEPFKRGHSGKPGTGLGLAIARRAIELQGGTIHAESTENEGCHFWLNIPKTVSIDRRNIEQKKTSRNQ